jgi:hypothetical protein
MKNLPTKPETKIQSACVLWFRMQYPDIVIYAIPNGGKRDKITAAILQREGVLEGVADLFIMHAVLPYNGYYIETKTVKGSQSDEQKAFQAKAEAAGYKYDLIRSEDEFIKAVNAYLSIYRRLSQRMQINKQI